MPRRPFPLRAAAVPHRAGRVFAAFGLAIQPFTAAFYALPAMPKCLRFSRARHVFNRVRPALRVSALRGSLLRAACNAEMSALFPAQDTFLIAFDRPCDSALHTSCNAEMSALFPRRTRFCRVCRPCDSVLHGSLSHAACNAEMSALFPPQHTFLIAFGRAIQPLTAAFYAPPAMPKCLRFSRAGRAFRRV